MNESDTGGGRPRNPLSDLPDRILAMLRASPAGEVEVQLKSLVSQAVNRLDLVTREEFEIQQAMVERLRDRLEAIEDALQSTSAPGASKTTDEPAGAAGMRGPLAD